MFISTDQSSEAAKTAAKLLVDAKVDDKSMIFSISLSLYSVCVCCVCVVCGVCVCVLCVVCVCVCYFVLCLTVESRALYGERGRIT